MGPILPLSFLPTLQMTVLSRAYRTNIIETADGLAVPASWIPVSTNVPTTASFEYRDTNVAGTVERYYRVRRP